MTTHPETSWRFDPIERRWAAAGVFYAVAPGAPDPDLERLLLDTARRVEEDARLLVVAVSWLALYSDFIARFRLKRLVVDELETASRPALGLLIDEAIGLGAAKDLRVVLSVCEPVSQPRPLAANYRDDPALRRIAESNASAVSRRWGLWAPRAALKDEAIRPVTWVHAHNPTFRDRAIRKGDLRCSIVETLRRDTPAGEAPSELALSRLCGASRSAVRKALAALVLEGDAVVAPLGRGRRGHAVRLRAAA